MNTPTQMLKIKEAAAMFNLSQTSVRGLAKTGKIAAFRPGSGNGTIYINAQSLQDFLNTTSLAAELIQAMSGIRRLA